MMALALDPKLLLLDEPTAGMGEQETSEITQLIQKLHRQEKLAIILIEHDMNVVFQLADRILVLSEGQTLAEGSPDEIAADACRAPIWEKQHDGSSARSNRLAYLLWQEPYIARRKHFGKRSRDRNFAGRNGAGKTTTLRSLVGLTRPHDESVQIFGNTTTGWPPYRVAALGVGYVPEGRRIFANLTIEENLKVPVERPGPWTEDRVYELFPRLHERRSNKGRQLSGGEQEMLAIARIALESQVASA